MTLRAGHREIFVGDSERARAFYEGALGFRTETVQEGGFVWMQNGDLVVLLRPGRRAPDVATYQEAASAQVLYTDDLAAERARMEAAGVVFRGTDGSELCLTFTDPDGNWFQLVDPESH